MPPLKSVTHVLVPPGHPPVVTVHVPSVVRGCGDAQVDPPAQFCGGRILHKGRQHNAAMQSLSDSKGKKKRQLRQYAARRRHEDRFVRLG